jgi:hypothetical protein
MTIRGERVSAGLCGGSNLRAWVSELGESGTVGFGGLVVGRDFAAMSDDHHSCRDFLSELLKYNSPAAVTKATVSHCRRKRSKSI